MASPNDLTDRKRRLLEDSERYRRAMSAELQNIKASTAWVPRTVGIVRATSPLIALAAPVLGFLVRRKKKHEPDRHEHKNGKTDKDKDKERGLVGKALLALEIFRKAKPFWDHFQRARERHAHNSKHSQRSFAAREK